MHRTCTHSEPCGGHGNAGGQGPGLLNSGLSDRMSRSEMAVLLPSLPTALQVMIAEIEDGKVESKNLCTCSACVPIGLAGRFWSRGRWLVGHSFFGAALVLKVCFARVLMAQFLRQQEFQRLFWSLPTKILLGANGRRAGGILQLACNGDSKNSAGVCGGRPDWPVSDHFSRQMWKQRHSGEGGREH